MHDEPCYRRWDAQACAGGERGVLPDVQLDWRLHRLGRRGGLHDARSVGQPYQRIQDDDGYSGTVVTRLFGDHDGRSHAFGTVTLGYDHQFHGRWVAGVFADYDFGNRKSHTNPGDFGDLDIYDVRLSQKDGHAWSIGGRLGVLASPSTLLFLSAGWTQVSTEADLSFWDDNEGIDRRLKLDNKRDGVFVGAGIETQLGRGLSLRGEYRFTRLDGDHRNLDVGGGLRPASTIA